MSKLTRIKEEIEHHYNAIGKLESQINDARVEELLESGILSQYTWSPEGSGNETKLSVTDSNKDGLFKYANGFHDRLCLTDRVTLWYDDNDIYMTGGTDFIVSFVNEQKMPISFCFTDLTIKQYQLRIQNMEDMRKKFENA